MPRRLHVAGSAHAEKTDVALLEYAQAVVSSVIAAHVASGGTVLCQIGGDPRHKADPGLRCLFDWTVMETSRAALDAGEAEPSPGGAPLVHAVCSESARERVSEDNEPTLQALREHGALEIVTSPQSWRFGALIRETQARTGEVLLTIGGAVGVEHLAELYAQAEKPIIPLDIEIGSFHEDSPLGGAWLAKQARTEPENFVEATGPMTAAAHIDGLRTTPVQPPADELAARVGLLLGALRPKRAFYVRLLDPASSDFQEVEEFFRAVVDPVVHARGYERVEVGTDPQAEGFINSEIFRSLHYADVAIVDMTGRRLNCGIELGYALARAHPVILCARAGDGPPPFDIDKLPFFFWEAGKDASTLRAELEAYWVTYAARPPVVTSRGFFGTQA